MSLGVYVYNPGLVNFPKPGDSPTKEQLEKAESDLDQSLALKPNDVRALYNLAWTARRRDNNRDNNFVRAIEILTKIIDLQKTLDQDDRGRRIVDAFTNRACYRALSLNPLPPDAAQDTEIQAKAALILADCQAACEEGKLFNLKEYCKKGFEREFSVGGDLSAIRPLLAAQAVDAVTACA